MKRTIALLLILCALLSLAACGAPAAPAGNQAQQASTDKTPADNQTTHTHSFGEWTTTKTPTCTVAGEQERTCACGEKQTQTIAAGHTYVNGVCTVCEAIQDADKLSEADSLIAQEKYEDAYTLLKGISSNPLAQKKLANFFWAPKTVTEKYDGEDWGKNQYVYNSMGNVSQWTETYHSGETEEYTFSYMGNGNLREGYPYMIYSTKYTYEYSNGKVSKETIDYYGDIYYVTYEYNEDGLPVKATCTGDREGTYEFEYNYYPSGKIKSICNTSEWLTVSGWYYDENGNVTKAILNDVDDMEMKFTYGEYGVVKAEILWFGQKAADFVYSYNTDGILTGMTATEYVDVEGTKGEENVFTFSDFTLIYSEDARVIERAKTVCYLPVNEFAIYNLTEIIW